MLLGFKCISLTVLYLELFLTDFILASLGLLVSGLCDCILSLQNGSRVIVLPSSPFIPLVTGVVSSPSLGFF